MLARLRRPRPWEDREVRAVMVDEGDAALVVGVDLERDALAVGRPPGGHRITVDVGDLLHIPPVRSHGEELAATRSLGVEDEESVDVGGWRGGRLRDRGRRDG